MRHTRRLFGGNIGILFYDVTTLYFETTDKDELWNNGFSKDGKNANPQVVLGLLMSRGGYPLSYALFNGAQFEGYSSVSSNKLFHTLGTLNKKDGVSPNRSDTPA